MLPERSSCQGAADGREPIDRVYWKLEAGSWKLEAGNGEQKARNFRLEAGYDMS
jgi:hypothetical protein